MADFRACYLKALPGPAGLPAEEIRPSEPTTVSESSMTRDETRDKVAKRWRDWQAGKLPARKYALLVTHYCRLGFHDDHWSDRWRALLDATEQAAGRWLPPGRASELQELARQLHARACRIITNQRESAEHGHAIWNLHTPVEPEAIRILGLSLQHPEQAVGELIASSTTDLGYLPGLMECLWPSAWEKSSGWFDSELPRDARLWALRIHDTQDYTYLPILADRLEDAGCPDQPLLDHCRSDYWHARGCAAVDRILGIEPDRPLPHPECRTATGATSPCVRLVGLSAGFEGREWSFDAQFEVGRLEWLGLVLSAEVPSHSVSRIHAVVYPAGGAWWVADRGSANGTSLNGTRLSGEPAGSLYAGDTLQFGAVALRVIYSVAGDCRPPTDPGPPVAPGPPE